MRFALFFSPFHPSVEHSRKNIVDIFTKICYYDIESRNKKLQNKKGVGTDVQLKQENDRINKNMKRGMKTQ